MDNQPLTKQDLEDIVEAMQHGFTQVHERIDSLQKFVKTDILESNEKIVTEIQAMRQEQAAVIGGRQRIDDTLLEHGDTLINYSRRINVLEGKPASNLSSTRVG